MGVNGLSKSIVSSEFLPLETVLKISGEIQYTDNTLTLFKTLDSGLGVDGFAIYDRMVSGDTHIKSCITNLFDSIRALDYDIISPVVEGNQDLYDEITYFVRNNLFEDLNFNDLIRQALRRCLYGFAIFEIMHDYDEENRIIVKSINYRGANDFKFYTDGSISFASSDGDKFITPEDMIGNFFIPTYEADDLNPFGRSLLGEGVYILYWAKKTLIKGWIKLQERYGSPTVLGRYNPSISKKERDEFYSMVENFRSNSFGIVPTEAAIELIENNVNAGTSYEAFINRINKEMSKAILGATLTQETDSKSGSYAQGAVHQETFQNRVRANAIELAYQITNQIIIPLVDLNYESVEAYPEFKFKLDKPSNVESKSKIITEMVRLGLPVGKKTAYELLGIPEPEKDEELIEMPAQTQSNSFGLSSQAMDDRVTLSFEQVLEKVTQSNQKIMLAEGGNISSTANEAEAQVEYLSNSDKSNGLFDKYMPKVVRSFQPLVEEYKKAIEKSNSYERLQSKLEGVYKNGVLNEWSNMMLDLSAFSYLYGRFTVYERSKKQLSTKGYPSKILTFWQAIDYFSKKMPLQDYPELPGRLTDHLNAYYFRVAGVQNLRLLDSLQKYIARSMEIDMPYASFKADVDNMFARFGVSPLSSHHLYTVGQTNTMTAYGAGSYEQSSELKAVTDIVTYVTSSDERVRPSHAVLNGYTADWDIFEKLGLFPPCGFNCRCSFYTSTKSQAKNDGLTISKSGEYPVVNGVTGQPDKGFEGNPSRTFWENQ